MGVRRSWAAVAALLLLLGACASVPARPSASLPPPPVHPHGQALWVIVSTLCVPGEEHRRDPAPCARVSLDQGVAKGFVLLKDRQGATQYLLMPTAKITGIEDPKLLAPGVTNYFHEAWAARGLVEAKLGRPLPREATSVAVNSVYGRSQDQLHLHIDCLDAAVGQALRQDAPLIGPGWSRRTFRLAGHDYRARRLDGEDLSADPFRLLADGLPGAAREMGAWTLVLVGETSPDGRPGFYLLADRADPAHGDDASGESLQDHACRGV